MSMTAGRREWRVAGALAWWLTGHGAMAAEAAGSWTTAERDGRVEARRGDTVMSGWQIKPLDKPAGGGKFAASAFLHPLRTPAGFEWTTIQPADHLHHFGLWWPWKFIEVGGRQYNCWEIQEGQGAHEPSSRWPPARTSWSGSCAMKW